MTEPSTAERARTVLHAASTLEVLSLPDRTDVVSVHGADGSGRPLLLVADGTYLARHAAADAEGEIVVVRAVDVCPVPMPDRVRGEVLVGGVLTEVPAIDLTAALVALAERDPSGDLLDVGAGRTLLRVDVLEVRLEDRLGCCGHPIPVEPDAFAAARPDPLADGEPEWLGHLVSAHPAEFAQLCLRIDPAERPPGSRLRPVSLDRYGLRIRAEDDAGHRDIRLPFEPPLTAADELPAAIARLLHPAGRR